MKLTNITAGSSALDAVNYSQLSGVSNTLNLALGFGAPYDIGFGTGAGATSLTGSFDTAIGYSAGQYGDR